MAQPERSKLEVSLQIGVFITIRGGPGLVVNGFVNVDRIEELNGSLHLAVTLQASGLAFDCVW